jgi:excisionase family DNA binding protein
MAHPTAPASADMEPVAVSVNDACRLSGLGRTLLYEAIAKGDLASCKIGNRRLILIEDLRAWIRRQRQPTLPR